jgi:hypothetical protein
MMPDVTYDPGFYDLTRQELWQDLDIVFKHARYRNLDIHLNPRLGPLCKQYDKWRKKFMKYELTEEDKAYMKQFYKDLKACERYSKVRKNVRGFLTDEMVQELANKKDIYVPSGH